MDLYQAICNNIQRENDLINHRVGWCIFTTAGLFTVESIIVSGILQISNKELSYFAVTAFLFLALAILSFGAAWIAKLTVSGVAAAQKQMEEVKEHYFEALKKDPLGPLSRLPRPFGDVGSHMSGNIVAKTFPSGIQFVWIAIGFIQVGISIFAWIKFGMVYASPPKTPIAALFSSLAS